MNFPILLKIFPNSPLLFCYICLLPLYKYHVSYSSYYSILYIQNGLVAHWKGGRSTFVGTRDANKKQGFSLGHYKNIIKSRGYTPTCFARQPVYNSACGFVLLPPAIIAPPSPSLYYYILILKKLYLNISGVPFSLL